MLDKNEVEQLDKAWKIIKIVWGAMIGSLAVYLLVCKLIENQLKPMPANFPLEILKTALFGVSILTFFVTYYIRKTLLKVSGSSTALARVREPSLQIQNPAAGKYITAVIVAMALSESIGIYGVVLFFVSRDSMMLYQFVSLSAIAMFYYRPRKEELMQVAVEMQKKTG